MCNREVLQSEDQLERPEKKRHPEPTYFCVQLTPSRVHFFILFLAWFIFTNLQLALLCHCAPVAAPPNRRCWEKAMRLSCDAAHCRRPWSPRVWSWARSRYHRTGCWWTMAMVPVTFRGVGLKNKSGMRYITWVWIASRGGYFFRLFFVFFFLFGTYESSAIAMCVWTLPILTLRRSEMLPLEVDDDVDDDGWLSLFEAIGASWSFIFGCGRRNRFKLRCWAFSVLVLLASAILLSFSVENGFSSANGMTPLSRRFDLLKPAPLIVFFALLCSGL